MSRWHERQREVKYIYDLPYTERKLLCNILDQNNEWETLGGQYMKFRWDQLQEFRRAEKCGDSPSDRLMSAWGQQNHTVTELFYLLWQMEHYQAMSALKAFIPAKYHTLLTDAETKITGLYVEGNMPIRVVSSQHSQPVVPVAQPLNGTVHHLPSRSTHRQMITHEPSSEIAGARALPAPSLKYSNQNLNHSTDITSHQSLSPKVPTALLHPMPIAQAVVEGAKPNPPQKQPVLCMEKKINNNDGLSYCGEVSCEDNNHSKKSCQYDFGQEYADRVAKKLGEIPEPTRPHCQPGRHQESQVNSLPPGNANTHPSPPSPLPQASEIDRIRRISNTSDTECNVPGIQYKELEEATACWNQDNLLGRGGFGTVFKGTWKNTQVAIKRIDLHENAPIDSQVLHVTQSFDELKRLQSYRHDNILQVYGYSADTDHPLCLVYQFMPNGSLEDRLKCQKIEAFSGNGPEGPTPPLMWMQRYRIAWGTARGLQYLHTVKEKPLIHGDVKSANILLDQNYEAKLGDFGLAREGKSQMTSLQVSRVHGTKPYLPEDFMRKRRLSVKVDTYSYGIVMFELCTGQRAYDEKRTRYCRLLKEYVEEAATEEELRDRNAGLEPDPEINIFQMLLQLGKECVKKLSTKRPDMTTVFKELESYGKVMEEKIQARKISWGESTSTPLSLYTLQALYPTGVSMQSPSMPPSTQPSLAVQSPPSPSFLPQHSPLPGTTFPPHFPPHPGVYQNNHMLPTGKKMGYAGLPGMTYGAVNGVYKPPLQMPQINVSPPSRGEMGRGSDPPSYSEAQAQMPVLPGVVKGAYGASPIIPGVVKGAYGASPIIPGVVEGAYGASPIIPNFADLDLNHNPPNNNTASSVLSESDYISTGSSLTSTTQNLGEAQIPVVIAAAVAPAPAPPPLLTALGIKSEEQISPQCSANVPSIKVPSAKGKKSLF